MPLNIGLKYIYHSLIPVPWLIGHWFFKNQYVQAFDEWKCFIFFDIVYIKYVCWIFDFYEFLAQKKEFSVFLQKQ